jgi:hypothetical protein
MIDPWELESKLKPRRSREIVLGIRTARETARPTVAEAEETAHPPRLSEPETQTCAGSPEPISRTIPEGTNPGGCFQAPGPAGRRDPDYRPDVERLDALTIVAWQPRDGVTRADVGQVPRTPGGRSR